MWTKMLGNASYVMKQSANPKARGCVSDAVRNSPVARACPAQGEDNDVVAEVKGGLRDILACVFS